MPVTTTSNDQHHSPGESGAAGHPSAEALSRVPPDLSHPGAQRSVAEVRIAILQAELRKVRAERDSLREQVRRLERRRDELRDLARSAIAERERRDASSRQAVIQRYERVIAEKHAHLEDARERTSGSAGSGSDRDALLTAVRESIANFARR